MAKSETLHRHCDNHILVFIFNTVSGVPSNNKINEWKCSKF
jgi:hypothetical protein